MPETLRALIVIMVIGLPVLWWTERTVLAAFPGSSLPLKRPPMLWPAWALVTLIAFFVPSLPLVLILAGMAAAFLARREPARLALFVPLLLAIPLVAIDLPTFGLVESLLNVDFSTVLTVVLLLPLFLRRSAEGKSPSIVVLNLVRAYLFWLAFLALMSSSFTGFLRVCALLVLSSYIPFEATRRSVLGLDVLHRIVGRFVVMAGFLAAIAIFEYARSWLLYSSLPPFWGVNFGLLHYLARGSALRAQVSAGQPIVLGFVIAAGLVAALSPALYPPGQSRRRLLLLALLAAGLFSTLSRGPWMGAIAGSLLYVALGKQGVGRTVKLGFALAIALLVLALLPGGEKIIDLLPWIGKADPGSTAYRADLFKTITPALIDSPIFGVPDFDTRPDFQVLRQGEHIIDLVNSYLEVGVRSGLVGLGLFVAAHLCALIGVYRRMRQETGDQADLLRGLLAAHGTALMVLATTSSISVIAPLTWVFLGLSAGCGAPRIVPSPKRRRSERTGGNPSQSKGGSRPGVAAVHPIQGNPAS